MSPIEHYMCDIERYPLLHDTIPLITDDEPYLSHTQCTSIHTRILAENNTHTTCRPYQRFLYTHSIHSRTHHLYIPTFFGDGTQV